MLVCIAMYFDVFIVGYKDTILNQKKHSIRNGCLSEYSLCLTYLSAARLPAVQGQVCFIL